MIKLFVLTTSILVCSLHHILPGQVRQPAGKLDINTSAGGIIGEVLYSEHKPDKNAHYLNENWLEGKLWMSNTSVIEGLKIRFDLKNDWFEIETTQGIRVLKANYVEGFELYQPSGDVQAYYESKKITNKAYSEVTGYFEILIDGKVKLLERVVLEVIPAGYNQALDVGERNNKFLTKRVLYFFYHDELIAIGKNRRKVTEQLNFVKGVDSFMKKNKTSVKKRSDMKELVAFLNDHIDNK